MPRFQVKGSLLSTARFGHVAAEHLLTEAGY